MNIIEKVKLTLLVNNIIKGRISMNTLLKSKTLHGILTTIIGTWVIPKLGITDYNIEEIVSTVLQIAGTLYSVYGYIVTKRGATNVPKAE